MFILFVLLLALCRERLAFSQVYDRSIRVSNVGCERMMNTFTLTGIEFWIDER